MANTDDNDQLNKTAPIPPVIDNEEGEFDAEGGGFPVDIDESLHKMDITTDDMNAGPHELNIAEDIDDSENPPKDKINIPD